MKYGTFLAFSVPNPPVYAIELETPVTHRFPILEAEKAVTLYANHQDGALKILLNATSWETSNE